MDPNSIVDLLRSRGQATDLNSRASLAVQYGLAANPQEYISKANSGQNASINTALINILRGGGGGGGQTGQRTMSSPNFNPNASAGPSLSPTGGVTTAPKTPGIDTSSDSITSMIQSLLKARPTEQTPGEIRTTVANELADPYAPIVEAQKRQNDLLKGQEIQRFDLASKHRRDMMLNSLASRGGLDSNDTMTKDQLNEFDREENSLKEAINSKYEVQNANIAAVYKEKFINDIEKEITRRTEAQAAKVKEFYDQANLALSIRAQDREKAYRDATLELQNRQADIDEKYKSGQLSVDQYNAQTNRLRQEADALKTAAETAKIKAESNPAAGGPGNVTNEEMIKKLNALKSNKGFSSAVGASLQKLFEGIPGVSNNIGGTNAADFRAELANIKALLTLPNLRALKAGGGGAMSDADREFIVKASTSLDPSMTEEHFKSTLNDIVSKLSGTTTGGAAGGTNQAGGTVLMTGPMGTFNVPRSQVAIFKQNGYNEQ